LESDHAAGHPRPNCEDVNQRREEQCEREIGPVGGRRPNVALKIGNASRRLPAQRLSANGITILE
jgi:hypothetical protein